MNHGELITTYSLDLGDSGLNLYYFKCVGRIRTATGQACYIGQTTDSQWRFYGGGANGAKPPAVSVAPKL